MLYFRKMIHVPIKDPPPPDRIALLLSPTFGVPKSDKQRIAAPLPLPSFLFAAVHDFLHFSQAIVHTKKNKGKESKGQREEGREYGCGTSRGRAEG